MLSEKLLAEMNEQIKLELYSGYLYLSMAAWFESKSLGGFAHWMRKQAGEEQEHALKFFDHINDRGGRVKLQALDQPPTEFKSITAVFDEVLEHEKGVTARIHYLYEIAEKENDYPSKTFLNWFVDEQVEEEKNASEIVEWMKLGGETPHTIFSLNGLLGKRGDD